MSKVITFLPSRVKLIVADEETILAAALRQNYTLKWGCDAGSCLACEAYLKEGSLVDLQGEMVLPSDSTILLCQHTVESDCQIQLDYVFAENNYPVSRVYCQVERFNVQHDVVECHFLLPAGKIFKRNEGDLLRLHVEGLDPVFKIHNLDGLESRGLYIEIPSSDSFLLEFLKEKKALYVSLPLQG